MPIDSKKIRNMIGNSYLYRTDQYVIRDIVHVEDDLYDVLTDKRTIRVNARDLSKEFLPVQIPGNGKTNSVALMKLAKEEMAPIVSLADILTANIAKIQKDPGYIKQAKAINDQAKTIISIAKLKLDVIKLARDR